MSSLLTLLFLGIGMTMGLVIPNSIEIEVEVKGQPSWDPPTCSSKYEDCIADIQQSLAAVSNGGDVPSDVSSGSTPPSQKPPGFESVLLSTLNCTKLYLQCRKDMQEAKKSTTTSVPDAMAGSATVF